MARFRTRRVPLIDGASEGPRSHRRVAGFLRRFPARAAVLVFCAGALVFTGLLSLPIASADGQAKPLHDAMFTAVSAMTVTGLTTVDTATAWSGFGQVVILLAIQVGGLGIVTLALLLARAVTRQLGLGGKLFAQQSIGTSELGEVGRLLRIVVGTTLVIEAVLLLILAPAFIVAEGSWWTGLWHGLFYAVSAFNNAGFSVHEGGLTPFDGNLWVLTPIMLGVFVGSFGFPVFLNLINARWSRRRWSLHTKLTLITTTILLAAGALGWAVFEWSNADTIGGMSIPEKLFHALFASTMTRSGGFSVVDTSDSTSTTLLLSDALMFVGGGSASTAGGIKVTTLAVLFLAILAEGRGTKDVTTLERTIPNGIFRVAISVTFLGATLVLVATTLLTLVSDAPLDRILFEVISAFATCGLSVGLSAELEPFGKYVLSALMLAGRIGPIGLAAALSVRQRNVMFTLPQERPIIG